MNMDMLSQNRQDVWAVKVAKGDKVSTVSRVEMTLNL